jgi:hypothetical protein
LKKHCQKSESNVKDVFGLLWARFGARNSLIRLAAVLTLDQLFMRSAYLRRLVCGSMTEWLALGVGSSVARPLPPPRAAAGRLRQASLAALERWCARYGALYPQLATARAFVADTLRLELPSAVEQRAADARERRAAQTQRVLRAKFEQTAERARSRLPELDVLLHEMDECLALLVPDVDDDARALTALFANNDNDDEDDDNDDDDDGLLLTFDRVVNRGASSSTTTTTTTTTTSSTQQTPLSDATKRSRSLLHQIAPLSQQLLDSTALQSQSLVDVVDNGSANATDVKEATETSFHASSKRDSRVSDSLNRLSTAKLEAQQKTIDQKASTSTTTTASTTTTTTTSTTTHSTHTDLAGAIDVTIAKDVPLVRERADNTIVFDQLRERAPTVAKWLRNDALAWETMLIQLTTPTYE